MTQIILNLEDNAPVAKIKNALKLLTGVISVRVKKECPNKDTLASIEDAKNGKYAGELDPSSMASIEESIMRL